MDKVLIACEESQTVCKAFRERGHEAYSCDIGESARIEAEAYSRIVELMKELNEIIKAVSLEVAKI